MKGRGRECVCVCVRERGGKRDDKFLSHFRFENLRSIVLCM